MTLTIEPVWRCAGWRMAWVQSSPKGGIRQGYSTHYGISTKFHRSPLPGRLGRLPPSGVLPRKEGVRASDHCPIFSFRRSTSRGAVRPAGAPAQAGASRQSRQARAAPQGPQGSQFAPSGGSSISSSRQRAAAPRGRCKKKGKHKSVCLCGLSPVQWLRTCSIKAQNLFHKGSE